MAWTGSRLVSGEDGVGLVSWWEWSSVSVLGWFFIFLGMGGGDKAPPVLTSTRIPFSTFVLANDRLGFSAPPDDVNCLCFCCCCGATFLAGPT